MLPPNLLLSPKMARAYKYPDPLRRLRHHDLFPADIMNRLPVSDTQEARDLSLRDTLTRSIVHIKLFGVSSPFVYYVLNICLNADPDVPPNLETGWEEQVLFGWCQIFPGGGEIGHSEYLHEYALQRVEVIRGFPKIAAIERDLYWKPKTLLESLVDDGHMEYVERHLPDWASALREIAERTPDIVTKT